MKVIKGSQYRCSEHPVDALFMDRWSPRAMSGEEVSEPELMTLLEAARWAPSSRNFQPWRMLYVLRSDPHWDQFLGLLLPANVRWAHRASALMVILSQTTFGDGSPCTSHAFDAGAAWQNFALQASLRNLVVRGIEGFDSVRARTELHIPERLSIHAMAAIGRPAAAEVLPSSLQGRERPTGRLDITVFARRGIYPGDPTEAENVPTGGECNRTHETESLSRPQSSAWEA